MKMNDFCICTEVVEEQPMVYARRVGAYGLENSILMEKFKAWVTHKGYMNEEAIILGIARDDVSVTPPDKCRYDVCLLGDYQTDEAWIKAGIMDAGKYVVIRIPHTGEAISYVWQQAFPYLMEQGYKLDFKKPILERYKKQLVDQHLCEMMFPLS